MAGRPPKSAAAKKAAGNPGKRVIKENILPAAAGVTPPAWVACDVTALAQWNALAPEMIARKTLTIFDVNRFGRYCVFMALFLKAWELVLKNGPAGMFALNSKGGVGSSAFVGLMLDADKDLRPLEEQFGFSPVSRNKLFAAEGDEGLSPAEKELRALEGGA